jgi:mRNA-degrading endonuclease RelE of RelBE toxin-antitoxin system
MSYHVEMTAAAHRLYKKFDAALQEQVKREAQTIAADPLAFKQLRPPFRGIRSYHFSFRGVSYRIAYTVDIQREVLTVVLVHTRENFYRLLRRVLGY